MSFDNSQNLKGHGRTPAWQLWVLLVIPVAFGLLAVLAGQDDNWDLRNYHRYNPYALLSGRVGVDLAPGGMQTYFNPTLDVLVYLMTENLPPRLGGFLMGALHGVAVLLLLRLGRSILPAATGWWTHLALALAGGLSATFLSELSNSMGDNTTALLVLAALVCLVSRSNDRVSSRLSDDIRTVVMAGILIGLATGLKLTNAPMAIGLVITTLFIDLPWRHRLHLAFATSVATALGILLTGGYWHWKVWDLYGNPFFPQFNNVFNSPLASSVGIVDTRWRPRSLTEGLLFPYVFTLQPNRIHELKLVQLLWPIGYSLILALGGLQLLKSFRSFRIVSAKTKTMEPSFHLLLAFVCSSYVVWMLVFSIGRYVVVLELLLPLLVWRLAHQLFSQRTASIIAGGAIVAASLVTVVRFENWGYVGWGERRYAVEVPSLLKDHPDAAVLLSGPYSWMIPDLPRQATYISLGRLPESDAYRQKAIGMVADRKQAFLLMDAAFDAQLAKVQSFNAWSAAAGITRNDLICRLADKLRQASPRYRHLELRSLDATPPDACVYQIPGTFLKDVDKENLKLAQQEAAFFKNYGLEIEIDSCKAYRFEVGSTRGSYQFCAMHLVPT